MTDFALLCRPFARAGVRSLGIVTLAGLAMTLGCTGDDGEQFSAGLDSVDTNEDDSSSEDEVGSDPECGNGVVESGEECDLGEDNGETEQCTPVCKIAVCGDGYVHKTYEQCDDANDSQNDYCLDDCSANVCGDGIVNEGVEPCDDGNDNNDDDCTNACILSTCGDGVIDLNEQCDDGNNDTSDACPACQFAFCGDGYTWPEHESCDDGNLEDDDACLNICEAAACGDGIVWFGEETCDDANNNDGDACPGSCQDATCGDGYTYLDGEETCDDGNNVSDDGCDAECLAEFCAILSNDEEENLEGNDWFDTCVDTPGDLIIVKLKDPEGNIVYQAEGTMVGDWTQNEVTSTGASTIEYNENSHNRLVDLDNGDVLFVAGKDADAGVYTCNTGLGDGYGIVIYPSNPNWYINPKMIVMGHRGGISNQPRNFSNWGPEYEISWNDGESMNSCTGDVGGLVPYTGEFTLRVKPQ